MKKNMIILTFIFLPVMLLAQNNEILKVNQGIDLTKVIDQRQYLLPEFTDGSVFMKGNTTSNAKLNYNLLLKEMQFMQGDQILSIVDQNTILLVIIKERVFVNIKKGFAEIIAENADVQLAVEKSIKVQEPPKEGAYGSRSETASIDKYTSVSDNGIAMVYLPMELQFKNNVTYYLMKNNEPKIASKKGFLKIFSAHKKEVDRYIEENKVNFSNEAHLKQLLVYCVGL